MFEHIFIVSQLSGNDSNARGGLRELTEGSSLRYSVFMKAQHRIITNGPEETIVLGVELGSRLQGGEAIELVSDIGGGKTTLVRGIAKGIDSSDQVMSPTFTISRIYEGATLQLHHFDFYRLNDPGLIAGELEESIHNPAVAVVIEWSDIVKGALPEDRLQIEIQMTNEDTEQRAIVFQALGTNHQELIEGIA